MLWPAVNASWLVHTSRDDQRWPSLPRTLVWDNEAGVGRGRPTSGFAAFAGLLATKIYLCRPRDPEAKGLVERANGYLETSFLPGRHFSGPDDFNTQLQGWLKVANRRVHRTLGARPADRWEADRAQMLILPAVDPPTWWRFQVRLGRDHYVRVDTCDYSVDPAAIGHQVTVLTDNDQVIVLASGGEIVAQHARCWARHQTLTDPEHAEAGQMMRHEARRRPTGQVHAVGSASGPLVEVEQRELGTYDRLFTVIDGGAEREAG